MIFWGPQDPPTVPSPGCPWIPLSVAQPSVTGHLPRRPPDTCATWTARARPEGPPWAEGRTWKAGSGLSQTQAHLCSQVTPPPPCRAAGPPSCSQRRGVPVSQIGTAVASPRMVGGEREGHTGMVAGRSLVQGTCSRWASPARANRATQLAPLLTSPKGARTACGLSCAQGLTQLLVELSGEPRAPVQAPAPDRVPRRGAPLTRPASHGAPAWEGSLGWGYQQSS